MGDLAFQTSNLFGVQGPSESQSSHLYSNSSGGLGTSGSISFLKDDDGQLIRGSDGELMPIAIVSRTAKDRFNGKHLDAKLGNVTVSIGLNSIVAKSIKEMQAVPAQTAQEHQKTSTPSADQSL